MMFAPQQAAPEAQPGAVTTPFSPHEHALFVEGVALALAHVASGERLGALSASLKMWLNIDPHVLLYAFLPLLLFGDAMNLNVHHVRQKIGQCLVLAFPGVLFGTFVTGEDGLLRCTKRAMASDDPRWAERLAS